MYAKWGFVSSQKQSCSWLGLTRQTEEEGWTYRHAIERPLSLQGSNPQLEVTALQLLQRLGRVLDVVGSPEQVDNRPILQTWPAPLVSKWRC